MADYGRPIEFGAFINPSAADPQMALRQAKLIDAAGLEYVTIQDHPYNSGFFETWTLLAYLGAATTRVRLAPNVANLPLRLPTMLAKSAATLDVLTGGRAVLGLGAGAFWDAIVAMGGERRSAGESVRALEEALQIIRAFWTQRSVHFEGEFYRVPGARTGPTPAQPIEIWLGAYGPRMLGLTGRLADGWVPSVPYAPPAALPEMQARIDDAAVAAGRTPAQIRRVYNLMGMIGSVPNADAFKGTAEQWVETLTWLTLEMGMDTFLFGPADNSDEQFEVFAAEVAPAVREAVARERKSG